MAKIIVKINIRGCCGSPDPTADQLKKEIEEARGKDDSWFSKEDGDLILVDEAYLRRSRADDSFYAFEFVGVEED